MPTARWTADDAMAWARERPWPRGLNFLPSTAVNYLEMWHPETFDPATIARELGWAADLGLNAVRVDLPHLVWEHDRSGLLDRVDRFLAVAADAGLSTVPCLLDDCEFGGAPATYARQPDPVPGVHNSRAVASPGRDRVMDRTTWPSVERYVRDLVGSFGDDDRVLMWDLYNEPGNRMVFDASGFSEHDAELPAHSLALMERCFDTARDSGPSQPLTVGAWSAFAADEAPPFDTPVDRRALELSDVVTFHAYTDRRHMADLLDRLAPLGRPIACTEWMARAVESRIQDQLPLFSSRGVGCFQWGLVRGRSQTHVPWPEPVARAAGATGPTSVWFHDLLHEDGTPYDQAEVDSVRSVVAQHTRPWTVPDEPEERAHA